jgi:intracellular multiplication protein IcmE
MSNNDDFDSDLDVEDFDDSGFDTYAQKGTLGDMWRNNPMVKVGVILAGFAIVVGGIILFGGSSKEQNISIAPSGSEVTQAPGVDEISETMKRSIEDRNVEKMEDAVRTGGSAVPMPTGPIKGDPGLQVTNTGGEDPLERWRRMQEERIRQQEMVVQTKAAQPEAPKPDTRTPAVNALSQSMVSQMQAVLQNQEISKMQHMGVADAKFLEEVENKKMQKFQQQQQMMMQNISANQLEYENIFLPAGTLEYAQLLIEANTDAPGPVMAQIASGPLRGSRVLGSFQSSEEYITLNFTQVVIDGINYPVEAVAIDPNTTLPGMVTEIDRRYLKRIVLPMAAEFISGLTKAISDSGTTTVVIEGGGIAQSTADKNSRQEVASGISAAGDELADILEDEADRTRPMLRIASGTPIGILFLSPVSDLDQVR